MSATYLDLNCHVIFATKNRHPWIVREWRDQLHGYIGGTIRGLGASPIAIGGTEDHVHLLIGLRGTHAVADVVRDVKKASSAWVKQNGVSSFAWQEGYAGLSVSSDHKNAVIDYIGRQEEHHKKWSSKDELRKLLEEAGIPLEEIYFE